MLFQSFEFLVFFPLVVMAYFLTPHRHRWVLLLVASYYFYGSWAPEYLVWIAISTLVAYFAAIQMAKTSKTGARKGLLILSLVANLGMLFAFKYLGFFGDALRDMFGRFGLSYHLPAFQVLLPVGISFYTLQTVSYVIDVYRGKKEPEKHLGIFALFVSFFPQLVAGPIERAGDLLPQFRVEHQFSAARASSGLQLMLWGMFKKVVIADRLSMYVNAVYSNPVEHHGWTVILATYFCAVQIYCDFSGYSDIAIGAAKVMGYDLTQNFRQPYCAPSITEFWRRWHISLSSWFRDYLYIPLGGNRVARWRMYGNLMVVFLVSGLWHGANWTFMLWGALHGVYAVFEVWSKKARDKVAQILHLEHSPIRKILGVLVTLNLTCFAWIFFQARSVPQALLLVRNLTQLRAPTDIYAPWMGAAGEPRLEMALALGLVALVAVVHIVRDQKLQVPPFLQRQVWVRWFAYLLLALAVMNLGVTVETPFIYFQF